MVEEASGLDMDDSNSLAAVKAAMARPAEFSPKCVDSTSPSLYIETTDIEAVSYTHLDLKARLARQSMKCWIRWKLKF